MNIIGAPVPKVIFHENVAAVKVVNLVFLALHHLIYIRRRPFRRYANDMQMPIFRDI